MRLVSLLFRARCGHQSTPRIGLVSRRTVAFFAAGAGLRAGATGSAGAGCVDVHLILLFVGVSRPNTDADGWRAGDITVGSLRYPLLLRLSPKVLISNDLRCMLACKVLITDTLRVKYSFQIR